jgi:hypothetical protein
MTDKPSNGSQPDYDQPPTAEETNATSAMADDPYDPYALAADPRDLRINDANLPETARRLGQHLAQRPLLFDRGGPARLRIDPERNSALVEPLKAEGVIYEAHEACRPYRVESSGERRDVTLPDRVAKLYLANSHAWSLRPLDGITTTPLLSPSGACRVATGYDPETRFWCQDVPSLQVPDAPTREDAEKALYTLRRFLRTFAFADGKRVSLDGLPVIDINKPPGADESAALVGLLTAVCRSSLPLAPALLVRAPSFSGAGVGKGLLVRVITAIAYGIAPRAMTAGGSVEEMDKRLVAALIGADPVIFLDNVNGTSLRSDMLASAITERPAYVRILGSSTTRSLNPSAFIAVTGNGLSIAEDLARRFVVVELDAGMEDPEARPFGGDILKDALEHRAELLSAALTIWRWGRQSGADLSTGRPLGSFNLWAAWVRDPLFTLGCADPVARISDAKADDPERRHIVEIYQFWWKRHHDLPVTVASLDEEVKGVIDPFRGSRQSITARVNQLVGTRATGFVLTRQRPVGHWSADLYKLQRTDAVAPTENRRGHRDHPATSPEEEDPPF